MSPLSDSQLVVLTAACQRGDRCVFPVTANAAGNVLKSLLKKNLIKEVRAKLNDLLAKFPTVSYAPVLVESDTPPKTYIHVKGDWRERGLDERS